MKSHRHASRQVVPAARRALRTAHEFVPAELLRIERLEDRRLLSVSGGGANDELDGAYTTTIAGLSDSGPAWFINPDPSLGLPLAEASPALPAGPSAEAMSFVLTALDEYIAAPDPSFSFELVNTFSGPGFDAHVLKLTSQTWRTTDEVNRTLWQHWLIVAVPQSLNPDVHTALLAITGGNNNSTTPPSKFSIQELGTISATTGTITAELRMVPNQPLTFADDGGRARTEDEIIAYSFNQFLETGDETWPALLPMVKSAVRAMDAVQQYVPTVVPDAHVDDFVVSGGSKRGWTTWLTAAADAAMETPRVKAIIPVVFDVLNVKPQLDHHKEYYEGVTNSIIAGYSNALQDYTELGVFDHLDTPAGQALLSIIDPYAYLDRLTLPKFMINSTGDEFFVPDSGQFYLSQLPGQNYVRYVPNTNHDVFDNSDGAESLFEYYLAIVYDQALPQYSWTVEDDGETIRVQTADTPLQVNLWQATNYDSRDFRYSVTGIPWTSSSLVDQGNGEYVAHFAQPNLGATAFFVELVYPGALFNFKFTTQVSVVSAETPTPVEPWLVPQQVDDINTDTYSSDVASLTDLNGILYFTAYDPTFGRELWKSNGTAAGTERVADIYPGPSGSSPRNLTVLNGALYFLAYEPAIGYTLWKSDGTAGGTQRVTGPQAPFTSPNDLTLVGSTLYFSAYDSVHGIELWKSDGTAEGTVFAADILPTSPYGYPRNSYPQNLTAVNGKLFFTAVDDSHGRELWTSDGTDEGTVLLKDIRSNGAYGYPRSSNPSNFTAVGNKLFFTATDDDHGLELWTSDGTPDGTKLVRDINPTTPYGFPTSSDPTNLTAVNGLLFFTATDAEHGRELWRSDGTEEGTAIVADIRPGSPYGYPRSSDPRYFAAMGGLLYFTATDEDHGRELWQSDGSAEGTLLVANVVAEDGEFGQGSYPRNLTAVDGTLYFTAEDEQHGRELWKSDGSAEGTLFVKDVHPVPTAGNPSGSSYPKYLTKVGGALYFVANDGIHGYELWKSNGTTDGTVFVKDVHADTLSSDPFAFTDVAGTLFFLVNTFPNKTQLWKSDGTSSGAQLVADYWLSNSVDQLMSIGNTLYFTATDAEHGRELWRSDGTTAGTRLVADIFSNGPEGEIRGSYPLNLTNFNGTLYFTAADEEHGNELWKSDGTAEGTVLVADIYPGNPYGSPFSSNPYFLTVVNGTLFFSAVDNEHGRELWKSDGTAEGTLFVADIRPGSNYGYPRSSTPGELTAVGNKLYFVADDGEHGTELWTSDGTTEGTQLVVDILPGSPFGYPRSSHPSDLTAVNGLLYFVASEFDHGRELWRSDGTADGTILLADVFAGPSGSYPSQLTESHGKLFFSANASSLGRELWKSDGTPEGTLPLKNIFPGFGSSYPTDLTDVNGLLFFKAHDGQHGVELWQSDGTTGGTVLVADNRPGSSGSYPTQLTNVGGTLFFAFNDGRSGNEPWILVQPVDVNIRPYFDSNLINLNSLERVAVAILGTETLDVTQIDRKSLTLAGADVATLIFGLPHAWLSDVNGDNRLDLIARFPSRELQLSAGDTSAILEGKLVNGQRIQGSDMVKIVGRPRQSAALADMAVASEMLESISGDPAAVPPAPVLSQLKSAVTSILRNVLDSALAHGPTLAPAPAAPDVQPVLKTAAVDWAIQALTSVAKVVRQDAISDIAIAKVTSDAALARDPEPEREDHSIADLLTARLKAKRLGK